MMKKYKKYWGDQDKQDFLLYVVVVLDLCFKLKYVRFYFQRVYDVEKAKSFTKNVRDTLLRLYDYYIMVDEGVKVMQDVATSRNKNDVNVDSMVLMICQMTWLLNSKNNQRSKMVWREKIRLRGIWVMVKRILLIINQIFQVSGNVVL